MDIKGFPEDIYVPDGRNAGHVEYIHGGVSRNVVEDIANLELRPTFLGIADNTALGRGCCAQNAAPQSQYRIHERNPERYGNMACWLRSQR